MSEEQDIELKVTERDFNKKYGITYIEGTFMLRIAEPGWNALDRLREHLREVQRQLARETGTAVIPAALDVERIRQAEDSPEPTE